MAVYRRLMDVNYLGTVALTKALVPSMVARRAGLVVSISSVTGKIGSKLPTGYSGSKYAVVGFMDCLRAELAEYDVACLTVCRGSIQTNIAINALNAEGETQQKNDDSIINSMPVDECVRQIIKGMIAGRDEVVVGKGVSAWAPTIKRFFPRFYNKLAARMEYRE